MALGYYRKCLLLMIELNKEAKLIDLKSMLPVEVAEYVKKMGEAEYRANQIFRLDL